jgi:hypothetical protein
MTLELRPSRVLALSALLMVACGSAEEPTPNASVTPTPAAAPLPTDSVGSPPPSPPPRAPFVFATAEPCSLLSAEQVGNVFGVEESAITATAEGREAEHRKMCRYTWSADGTEVALTVDAMAKREGPGGASFDRAVEVHRQGMPVVGREGVVQRFETQRGIGDELRYSGNVEDSKGLFVRFGETHLVSLQHHHSGHDTGDLRAQLLALARPIARKLMSE